MSEESKTFTGGQAGFPCPNCQTFIPTTIETLFRGQLFCQSCGLKLTMSEPLDQGTKDALQGLSKAQTEVKNINDEYK